MRFFFFFAAVAQLRLATALSLANPNGTVGDAISPSSSSSSSSSHLRKRVGIEDGCTEEQKAQIENALAKCAKRTRLAAEAVAAGNDEITQKYFKTTDDENRQVIAARYNAIADQCAKTDGRQDIYMTCVDEEDGCNDRSQGVVLGYAMDNINTIVLCPAAFELPLKGKQCGDHSLIGLIIHELTHLSVIYQPPTVDHAYERDGVVALTSPEQAIMNADTYQWFAMDVYQRCPPFPPPSSDLSRLAPPSGGSYLFLVTGIDIDPEDVEDNDGIEAPIVSGNNLYLHALAGGGIGQGYVSMYSDLQRAVENEIPGPSHRSSGYIYAVQQTDHCVNSTRTLNLEAYPLPADVAYNEDVAVVGGFRHSDVRASAFFEGSRTDDFAPNPAFSPSAAEVHLDEPTPELAGYGAQHPIWEEDPWHFYADYSCPSTSGSTKRQQETCPNTAFSAYYGYRGEIEGQAQSCYQISNIIVQAELSNDLQSGTSDDILIQFYGDGNLKLLFQAPSRGAKATLNLSANDIWGRGWVPSYYLETIRLSVRPANDYGPLFNLQSLTFTVECTGNNYFAHIHKYKNMNQWLGSSSPGGAVLVLVWTGEFGQADLK